MITPDGNKWLAELKPGDKVFEKSSGMGQSARLLTVAKITPTQVVLGSGTRIRKKDGERVGEHNPWSWLRFYEATPERVAAHHKATRKQSLALQLSNVNWRQVPLETLETVWANVKDLVAEGE